MEVFGHTVDMTTSWLLFVYSPDGRWSVGSNGEDPHLLGYERELTAT